MPLFLLLDFDFVSFVDLHCAVTERHTVAKKLGRMVKKQTVIKRKGPAGGVVVKLVVLCFSDPGLQV